MRKGGREGAREGAREGGRKGARENIEKPLFVGLSCGHKSLNDKRTGCGL
jgi:hypothetical protein